MRLSKNGIAKTYRVNRLIALIFINNPLNKKTVNHKDGNKLNNALNNLEWATPKENAIHAVTTGLCDARRIASEKPVIQLDLLGNFITEFASLHDAERQTKVCWQNIYKVCSGKRKTTGGYKWVTQ